MIPYKAICVYFNLGSMYVLRTSNFMLNGSTVILHIKWKLHSW